MCCCVVWHGVSHNVVCHILCGACLAVVCIIYAVMHVHCTLCGTVWFGIVWPILFCVTNCVVYLLLWCVSYMHVRCVVLCGLVWFVPYSCVSHTVWCISCCGVSHMHVHYVVLCGMVCLMLWCVSYMHVCCAGMCASSLVLAHSIL